MARSDRPAPPRVSPALTPVDLADIDDGDLGEGVALSGRLLASFDQPLHLSNGRIGGASFVGAALVGSRLVGAEFTSATYAGVAWWGCNLTDADTSKIAVTRGQLQGSVIDDLRGAMSLAPIAIDADQEPAFAALLLATLAIEVTARLDD